MTKECDDEFSDPATEQKMEKDGWRKVYSNCTHAKWDKYVDENKATQFNEQEKKKKVEKKEETIKQKATFLADSSAADDDDDTKLVSDDNSKPAFVPETYMNDDGQEYYDPGPSPKNLEILRRLLNGGYMYTRGLKGAKGKTGPKGCVGDKGDKGPKGKEGKLALLDPKVKGPPGDPGHDGPRGPRGDKGDTGDVGEKGVVGPQGVKGRTGRKGAPGLTGPKGPTGNKGKRGPKGPKGPRGKEGRDGQKGAVGDQGIKGPQGIVGIQGPTGNRGPRGNDAKMPEALKMKYLVDDSLFKFTSGANNSIQEALKTLNSSKKGDSTQYRLIETSNRRVFLPLYSLNSSQIQILKEFDLKVGDTNGDYDFSKLEISDPALHEKLMNLIQDTQIPEPKVSTEEITKKKLKSIVADILNKCSFSDSLCSRECMWTMHSLLDFLKEQKYSMVVKSHSEADFKEKLKTKAIDCSLVWNEY